jgi:UMP-CMP kinase
MATAAVSSSSSSSGSSSALSAAAAHKPSVIFVLGGPGSGKGTQSERLSSTFGYVHLSAGELLRQERESGSPEGALIEEYLREGRIVPVELSLGLLKKAMVASGATRFLIDGFPRNQDNLEGWQRVMGNEAEVYDTICNVDTALYSAAERETVLAIAM